MTNSDAAAGLRCGWSLRWGIPLIAGLSALTAAAAIVDWLWEFGLAAALSRDGSPETLRVVVAAGLFSLSLMACRRIVCAGGRGEDSLARVADGGDRRALSLLAMVATAVGVALHAYFLDLPLRADESTTLVYFASQPFGTAASSYPCPNNHVFHTMLAWSVYQFSGLNRVALRLPALLSFCLMLPALWWFVRREYGSWAAALSTSFVATMGYFITLSTNARGYTLLLLLFVGALLCGQSLVQEPARGRLWAVWAATISLGFFTMPLMVFPAATVAIWMVLARWRRHGREGLVAFARSITVWLVVSLLLVAVLYAPVLAMGADAVRHALSHPISATWNSTGDLLSHAVVVQLGWHYGTPTWVQAVLMTLAVVGAAAPARTCRHRGTLAVAAIVATSAVFLIKPHFFAHRMLSYLLLVFAILAGVGAATVLRGILTWASRTCWPVLATNTSRTVAMCCAVTLILCAYGACALRPESTSRYEYGMRAPTNAFWSIMSIAERIRAGDYFTAEGRLPYRIVHNMMALHHVDYGVGWYESPRDSTTSPRMVHRVPAAHDDGRVSESSSGEPRSTTAHGRLFIFAKGTRTPGASGAQGPSYELVAAHQDEKIFLLDDWTPSKRFEPQHTRTRPVLGACWLAELERARRPVAPAGQRPGR